MNPIEICKKNEGKAKEKSLEDRSAWMAEGKRLKAKHPWIGEKAQEIREVFGGFSGLTIRQNGKVVWKWDSSSTTS